MIARRGGDRNRAQIYLARVRGINPALINGDGGAESQR